MSDRIIKIRLGLCKYDLEVTYIPGSKMFVADQLSRNFVSNTAEEEEQQIEWYIHNIYSEEPVLDYKLIGEKLPYMRICLK